MPSQLKYPSHSTEQPTKAKIIHRASTTCSTDSGERSDSEDDTVSSEPKVMIPTRRMSLSSSATSRIQHFGSFYLRMGAVGTVCERWFLNHTTVIYDHFSPRNHFSIRHWQHDLLGAGVRAVLRARAGHQMPQCAARVDSGHPDGIHLHPNVFHIPQQ